jgi:hypothetical protein
MNLQNGYKVIYEKIADGNRTFYATKNVECNPAVDDKIVEAKIGQYKLIYEKDGCFYGSESGIPAEGDYCFSEFDKVFKVAAEHAAVAAVEEDVPANNEPEVIPEPVVEEPMIEDENDPEVDPKEEE